MDRAKGDVTRLMRSVETHPWAHLEAGYWRVQVEDHPVLGYVLRVRAALGDPFTYEIHGEYVESENLYKLGACYYDATTGRFTQYDPSGQENNPYTYAAGNPVNSLDPSGLGEVDWEEAGKVGLTAGVGGAVGGCVSTLAACPAGAATGFVGGAIAGYIGSVGYQLIS